MTPEERAGEARSDLTAPSQALAAPEPTAALRNAIALWAEQNTRPEALSDPNVLVDQYQGLGKMKVDYADLAQVVQPNGTTYAEQAAHILVEANEGRKKGLKDAGATPEIHTAGINAGNEVRKRQGLQPRNPANETNFAASRRLPNGGTEDIVVYQLDYGSHYQYVAVKATIKRVNGIPTEATPTGTVVQAQVVPKR